MTLSGTSMSAPITAGVVAMILQRQPAMNNSLLQALLAVNGSTPNVLVNVGAGSPNKLVYSMPSSAGGQIGQLSGGGAPFFSTGFGYVNLSGASSLLCCWRLLPCLLLVRVFGTK